MVDYYEIAKIAGPFVGGGAIGGLFTYLKSRTSSPAEIAVSNANVVASVAEQMKVILAEHHKDRRDLRNQVNRQGRDIRSLTKAVAECREHHDICEDNLTKVHIQIAEMMNASRTAATLVINPHEPLKDPYVTDHTPDDPLHRDA